MIKRYMYTFFSLAIATLFLFGSMQVVFSLLHAREKDLLSETGKIVLQSPVRAWDSYETEQGISGSETTSYPMLTTEQIELAVSSWNRRTWEISHNPIVGQISMEEAIYAAETWLVDMEMLTELPQDTFVSSILGVGNSKDEPYVQLEPFYSFWTVDFESDSMDAVLYVNAVTGKIYGAHITFYKNTTEIRTTSYKKLERFTELAGLQGNDIMIDGKKQQAELYIENSNLVAKMKVSSVLTEDYGADDDKPKEKTTRSCVSEVYELNKIYN